jgi:hypothetical protein
MKPGLLHVPAVMQVALPDLPMFGAHVYLSWRLLCVCCVAVMLWVAWSHHLLQHELPF